MIITRQYARRLVKTGRAVETMLVSGGARWPDYPHYIAIDRRDIQRTDHYLATAADESRIHREHGVD